MELPREHKRIIFPGVVILLLLGSALAGITIGSTDVALKATFRVVGLKLFPFWFSANDVSRADEVIVWLIRVPRTIVDVFGRWFMFFLHSAA